jgi:hypothetical protein
MNGNNKQLDDLDSFITKNYNKLRKYCLNYNIDEDMLQNAYLTIRKRIEEKGWSGNSYTTYFVNSMVNANINRIKSLKHRMTLFLIDEDNQDLEELFPNLYDLDDYDEYINKVNYVTMKLLKFITYECQLTDNQIELFKIYYMQPTNKRITYRDLEKQTSNNITYIHHTFKLIREKIKNNFKEYLNNNETDDIE